MSANENCGVIGCTRCQPGQQHYCRVCKKVGVDHLSSRCPSNPGSAKKRTAGKLKAAVAQARGDAESMQNTTNSVLDLTDDERPRKKTKQKKDIKTATPSQSSAPAKTATLKISPKQKQQKRPLKIAEQKVMPAAAHLFDAVMQAAIDPVLSALPPLPQDRRRAAEQIVNEARGLQLIKVKGLNDREARIRAGTFLQSESFNHAVSLC